MDDAVPECPLQRRNMHGAALFGIGVGFSSAKIIARHFRDHVRVAAAEYHSLTEKGKRLSIVSAPDLHVPLIRHVSATPSESRYTQVPHKHGY